MYGPDPKSTYPNTAEWVGKVMDEVKPHFGGQLMLVTIENDDEAELDLITADGASVAIIERVTQPRFLSFIIGDKVTDYLVFSVVTSSFFRIAHTAGEDYPEVRAIVEKHSPHLNKSKKK